MLIYINMSAFYVETRWGVQSAMTASIAFNDVMTALNIVTGKYVVDLCWQRIQSFLQFLYPGMVVCDIIAE